ncbi:MAG: DMT family transporter, partial [Reyranella sp.]|nr:DMT family transporter [Reyranella sp.]
GDDEHAAEQDPSDENDEVDRHLASPVPRRRTPATCCAACCRRCWEPVLARRISCNVAGGRFVRRLWRGATGFGYVVWYLALRHLTSLQAATVQLSMPAIVALGGVVFLAEALTARLLIASAAMLGGIAVVLLRRPVKRPSCRPSMLRACAAVAAR